MRLLAHPSFVELILPFVGRGEESFHVNYGVNDLPKNMNDFEIFSSYFGGEQATKRMTFPLDPIHSIITEQEEDSGPLLTNGKPNIFYTLSRNGTLLVVAAMMVDYSFCLAGFAPTDTSLWVKGSRVFRNIRLLH